MKKVLNVLKYVGFGILGIGFMIALTFGIQALWNWLIPELFNGPELTFWQTVGLFILSKILLTGVAPGGSDKNDSKKWKKKYQEKCKQKEAESQIITTAEQV